MRDLNLTTMQAVMAESTNEHFLKLVTFSHDDWEETLRFCDDIQDIESNGETYSVRGFVSEPPSDSGSELVSIEFAINNVDQLFTPLVLAVREHRDPVIVTWALVLRSDPDTIVGNDVREFEARDYTFDWTTMGCTLIGDINARELVPGDLQGRTNNPGAYEEA